MALSPMDNQQCVVDAKRSLIVSLWTILFEIAKVHQSFVSVDLIAVIYIPAHFMNILMTEILRAKETSDSDPKTKA